MEFPFVKDSGVNVRVSGRYNQDLCDANDILLFDHKRIHPVCEIHHALHLRHVSVWVCVFYVNKMFT